MSDDQHSDLIRRLHEEGSAKAPDGLRVRGDGSGRRRAAAQAVASAAIVASRARRGGGGLCTWRRGHRPLESRWLVDRRWLQLVGRRVRRRRVHPGGVSAGIGRECPGIHGAGSHGRDDPWNIQPETVEPVVRRQDTQELRRHPVRDCQVAGVGRNRRRGPAASCRATLEAAQRSAVGRSTAGTSDRPTPHHHDRPLALGECLHHGVGHIGHRQ